MSTSANEDVMESLHQEVIAFTAFYAIVGQLVYRLIPEPGKRSELKSDYGFYYQQYIQLLHATLCCIVAVIAFYLYGV